MELATEPKYVLGLYQCRATILCRLPDARRLFDTLIQKYASVKLTLDNVTVLHLKDKQGLCARCGLFQKEIEVNVRQLEKNHRAGCSR